MVHNVKTLLPALLCLLVIGLAGCGKKVEVDAALKTDAQPVAALGAVESLDSVPLGISEGRTTEGMLPVYFDFDQADIRPDQVPRIEFNADFIGKNAEFAIRIEGNCDPRGTKEYNMALGERRALSAQNYLIRLGISEARLSTVSYGAERILLHGQNELAWAQNRRADFVAIQ